MYVETNSKPNPLKDLVNNFREYGVFPTDQQMQDAIDGSGVQSLSVLDLELNLFNSASKDETHPYHPMTQPIGGMELVTDENGVIQDLIIEKY